MERINVKFARMYEGVIIPSKRDEDAGLDIYASPKFIEEYCGAFTIPAHSTKIIMTGLKSVIQEGYYANLAERGSTGTIGMKYSAGIIDCGYRGEWMIPLSNVNDRDIILVSDYNFNDASWKAEMESEYLSRGYNAPIFYNAEKKAVCQAIIHKSPIVEIEEISLEEVANAKSERGDTKLGQSGK